MSNPRRWRFLWACILLLAVTQGCAINPATGKRQLSLIGESQEVEMGREADQQMAGSLGLYDDPELQRYVQSVGEKLARLSERPDLPWTFRVVDDPVVNAFALPGGFIYVTRGILAYFGSEAELAAVLGHEIGHVTARHSVNQISKSQLAGLGISLGAAVEPELANYEQLTAMGLGALFLKFSRDDERQADDLGLRYMTRAGYAPGAMVNVFQMLGDVGRAQGGGRVPGWLSTHPAPENRQERMQTEPAGQQSQGVVATRAYLEQVDGLVYGSNPRQGFFRGNVFYHPELRFLVGFPADWKTSNETRAVYAIQPQKYASIQISLATGDSARSAADAFFGASGITRGSSWLQEIHGLPTVSATFTTVTEGTALAGLAAFVSYEGRIYRLLGLTTTGRWDSQKTDLKESLSSFQALTSNSILATEARRLQLTTLDRPQTLQQIQQSSPSTVTIDELALLNRVRPDQRLETGQMVKRVVGGP